MTADCLMEGVGCEVRSFALDLPVVRALFQASPPSGACSLARSLARTLSVVASLSRTHSRRWTWSALFPCCTQRRRKGTGLRGSAFASCWTRRAIFRERAREGERREARRGRGGGGGGEGPQGGGGGVGARWSDVASCNAVSGIWPVFPEISCRTPTFGHPSPRPCTSVGRS